MDINQLSSQESETTITMLRMEVPMETVVASREACTRVGEDAHAGGITVEEDGEGAHIVPRAGRSIQSQH